MNKKARLDAEYFLNQEKQFHLGVLPTEQSNPKTRNIDLIFKADLDNGIKTLLAVDYDVAKMTSDLFAGKAFRELVNAGLKCLNRNGNIVFSGCGATGRLSILLESMWRKFFPETRTARPEIYEKIKTYENRVFSIMTGGDYRLTHNLSGFILWANGDCRFNQNAGHHLGTTGCRSGS